MKHLFRSISIALAAGLGLTAAAQPTPPFDVTVAGNILNCAPGSTVNITTIQGTQPAVDIDVPVDPQTCTFGVTLAMDSYQGWFLVSTQCNGAIQTDNVNYTVNALDPDSNYVYVIFNCGNSLDCMGVPGGNALPGTPCTTPAGNIGYYNTSCICVDSVASVNACFNMVQTAPFEVTFNSCTTGGTGPYSNLWDFSDGGAVPGDGIAHTYAGPGTYTVCLNVTDADGNGDSTCEQVYVDANGGVSFDPPTCQACFTIEQTATGGALVPFSAEFINCTAGSGSVTYNWWLPNGNSSTSENESFVFPSEGVYGVCLTMTDMNNCTSTLCDTVIVDANGGISTDPAWYDCMGELWGPAVAGTPCDDGDPLTTGEVWGIDCSCAPEVPAPCTGCFTTTQASTPANGPIPFLAYFENCSTGGSGPFQYAWSFDNGVTYSNGPADTTATFTPGTHMVCMIMTGPSGNGCSFCDSLVVDANGNINGNTPIDCLGNENGTALPGTPCTIQGTVIQGTWDSNCNCVPNNTDPCEAGFWVIQAYEIDSLNPNGSGTPIPYELWVWNLSEGGTGFYTFHWDFGDGTSSNEAFPTHVYPGSGPYLLCLSLTDSDGCTDTYCDSIAVDADGIYQGIMPGGGDDRAVLTLNVIDPLITAVPEAALGDLNVWPNPVQGELNITLNSAMHGTVDLMVIDASGRTVSTARHAVNSGNNRLEFNAGELKAGIYLLRITNGREHLTQRFVRTY
ncbi:MAG: PKD domain-containing protein [Flavobacteriales bacterium]